MQLDQIRTVMLDMDGTLLDLHFDNYFWLEWVPRQYAKQHGLDSGEALSLLMEKFNRQRGLLNWYCLDYWSQELELDIVGLKSDIQEKIAYRPHTKAFLKVLQHAGLRTIIVTNAHQDSLSLKVGVTKLDHYVDHIYCSHDFQVPKESQRFWCDLAVAEAFDAEYTLLIDDSLDVLRSAKQFGIKHLLCISKPDMRQGTKQIDEFDSIVDFDEILPIFQGEGGERNKVSS